MLAKLKAKLHYRWNSIVSWRFRYVDQELRFINKAIADIINERDWCVDKANDLQGIMYTSKDEKDRVTARKGVVDLATKIDGLNERLVGLYRDRRALYGSSIRHRRLLRDVAKFSDQTDLNQDPVLKQAIENENLVQALLCG